MLSSLNCDLCVCVGLKSWAGKGCEAHEGSGRVAIVTVFIIRNVPWNINKKTDATQPFFHFSPEDLRQERLVWSLCFQRFSEVPGGVAERNNDHRSDWQWMFLVLSSIVNFRKGCVFFLSETVSTVHLNVSDFRSVDHVTAGCSTIFYWSPGFRKDSCAVEDCRVKK